MNGRGRAAKTVAPDDPTPCLNEDKDAPRQALQHRMNRRLGQVEASVYSTVTKKPTKTVWREVLQHRMNRRTVGA
jgi:hypothetical protein